jgi:hypothetical protein
MNPNYTPILVAIVRHALALLGAGGMFSEGDISQMVGALFVLGSVAWSIYEKTKKPPPPPVEPLSFAPSSVLKYGKRDR